MHLHGSTLRIVARRPEMVTSACLVRLYPPEPCGAARHPLGDVALLLGRDEGCDIRIDDQSVSRRHARVQPAVDGCYAIDLDSRNGTLVNDQRITKARLHNGDSLRIGNSLFRFLDSNDIEAAYHEELERLANLDPLTETFNRRYLVEFLQRELARSGATGRRPALVLFDVNELAALIGQIGRAGGDAGLRSVAACLRRAVRAGDVLARLGGEEFALLLPEATPEVAAQRAEEIRRLVQAQAFEYQGVRYSLTVTTGVAGVAEGETITAREFLRRADRMLSEARRSDRNAAAG
jgi:diguanylate cyclase (GGDEF)-like protein